MVFIDRKESRNSEVYWLKKLIPQLIIYLLSIAAASPEIDSIVKLATHVDSGKIPTDKQSKIICDVNERFKKFGFRSF